MKEKNMQYYILEDQGIPAAGKDGRYWIYDFEKREWAPDVHHIFSDAVMGYDPGEPEDSPYRIGNTDVIEKVKPVSYEAVRRMIDQHAIRTLIDKWKKELPEKKKAWDEKPGWPAKYVSTSFSLNQTRYVILPEDLIDNPDSLDEGFFESIQRDLEKDLLAIGAADIVHAGDLD
jgi:hypothetical protein